MPRKRKGNQFRRGSEQKYFRSKPTSVSRTRAATSSLHLPNWLIMTMVFSLGVMLTATVVRTNLLATVSKTDVGRLVPNVQIPRVTMPSISLPEISLPKLTLPKVTMPKVPEVRNPIPKVDIKSVTLPRFTVDFSPIWQVTKNIFAVTTTTAANTLRALNPMPVLRSLWGWVQTATTTLLSWVITFVQLLDPRPLFPAVRQGFVTIGMHTVTVFVQVAKFVNPIPFLRLAWHAEMVVLRQAANSITTIATYAWQATITSARVLYHITLSVQTALWKTAITVANVVRTITITVFQFIRWVIVSIYNFIVTIVRTIVSVIQSISRAIQGTMKAIADFFRPYAQLISGGFNNGTAYFKTSSEQSKEIMGGMFNQYSETTKKR